MKTDEEREAGKGQAARQYRIDIFMAWCKSCGICVAFCPRKCLAQNEDGSPVVTRPDLCSGCAWCEIHCPDFAISLTEVTNGKAQGEEEAE
jgi:2-oxoglutarate ferredoxin oxidoreductase subunit delta